MEGEAYKASRIRQWETSLQNYSAAGMAHLHGQLGWTWNCLGDTVPGVSVRVFPEELNLLLSYFGFLLLQ